MSFSIKTINIYKKLTLEIFLFSRYCLLMPAKNLQRANHEGIFVHVYNRGISKKIIFNDAQDYETFISYLKDYLIPPNEKTNLKKTFVVKGHTYKGLPHQIKNYYNQIELLAYSLQPGHFHLLLHQKVNDSLQNFIRSLSTRYAIYFNKKYNIRDSLFQGPYKSIEIVNDLDLLYLTHYLHNSSGKNINHANPNYSSYPEYLGERATSWIHPEFILSNFTTLENEPFKSVKNYKNFVEKYLLTEEEKVQLERNLLESPHAHIETPNEHIGLPQEHIETPIATLERSPPEIKPNTTLSDDSELRIPEIVGSFFLFVFLFSLGYLQMNSFSAKVIAPISVITGQIAGQMDFNPDAKVKIKTNNDSPVISIRQEPSSNSVEIETAKSGDTFEFISLSSGWYKVKLAQGSVGYIAEEYIEITN